MDDGTFRNRRATDTNVWERLGFPNAARRDFLGVDGHALRHRAAQPSASRTACRFWRQ
jgi:hypothetical protein